MWMGNYFYTVEIYVRYLSLATRQTTQWPRRRHSKQTQTKHRAKQSARSEFGGIKASPETGVRKKTEMKGFPCNIFARIGQRQNRVDDRRESKHANKAIEMKMELREWCRPVKNRKSCPICILHEAINGVRSIFHIFLLFPSSVWSYR